MAKVCLVVNPTAGYKDGAEPFERTSMGVFLQKGTSFSLTDRIPDLQEIFLGVGWEAPQSEESNFVLDASLFLLGSNGSVKRDDDFVFYNQKSDHHQSVRHVEQEDNGVIGHDREGFVVSLGQVPADVDRLVCCLTIDNAAARQQNFGMLPWVYLRLINQTDENEIARYYLTGGFGLEDTLLLGEIQRHQQTWKFQALGQGTNGGLEYLATHFGVHLESNAMPVEKELFVMDEVSSEDHTTPGVVAVNNDSGADSPLKRKRRSPAEIVASHTETIKEHMKSVLPKITMASLNQGNESQSRMILDRILQDVLGYQMDDIKTEQKIQGRKADYVLTIDGLPTMVIETKRVGSPLRDKQIFQATSYAAYAGIHWALLTNLVAWQLFRVSTNDKVEACQVFEINLQNGLNDDAAHYLTLLSRFGMTRQGLLEKLWIKRTALSCESLISAILNEEVISKIRAVIVKETNCQVTNQEIQAAIEKDILEL